MHGQINDLTTQIKALTNALGLGHGLQNSGGHECSRVGVASGGMVQQLSMGQMAPYGTLVGGQYLSQPGWNGAMGLMGPQQPPQGCSVSSYGMGPYGWTPTLQSSENPEEGAYNRLTRGSEGMAELVHVLEHQPWTVI